MYHPLFDPNFGHIASDLPSSSRTIVEAARLNDDLDDLLDDPTLTSDARATSLERETSASMSPRRPTPPPLPSDPRAELADLVGCYRDEERYSAALQRRYCDLSLALNNAGLWAPAYRPTLKIPRLQRDRNASHRDLLRDRITFDLHWMHRRGFLPLTGDARIADLLDPAHPFDFATAREFAERKWTLDYRNEIVSLTPQPDAELGMLRSARMRDLMRECLEGSRPIAGTRLPPKIAAVRQVLVQWSAREPRIKAHVQSYLDLWLARELLGEAATRRSIAELAALMRGTTPKHERTASDQLAKLDRLLRR